MELNHLLRLPHLLVDPRYTISLQSFKSGDCDSSNEWISSSQLNLSMRIAYQCGATNDCLLRFTDRCAEDGDNERYYPLRQCLNSLNDSSSFRIECDAAADTFSNFKFDCLDCLDTAFDSNASMLRMQASKCMQFVECIDTPPSMPHTPSPAPRPSRAPTYYVSFWNKSLDQAQLL